MPLFRKSRIHSEREGVQISPTWSANLHISFQLLCTKDKSIAHIFNVDTGVEIQKLVGHTADITSLLFLEDTKEVVTCGEDSVVSFWNVKNGERTWKLHFSSDLMPRRVGLLGNLMLVVGHHKTLNLAQLTFTRLSRTNHIPPSSLPTHTFDTSELAASIYLDFRFFFFTAKSLFILDALQDPLPTSLTECNAFRGYNVVRASPVRSRTPGLPDVYVLATVEEGDSSTPGTSKIFLLSFDIDSLEITNSLFLSQLPKIRNSIKQKKKGNKEGGMGEPPTSAPTQEFVAPISTKDSFIFVTTTSIFLCIKKEVTQFRRSDLSVCRKFSVPHSKISANEFWLLSMSNTEIVCVPVGDDPSSPKGLQTPDHDLENPSTENLQPITLKFPGIIHSATFNPNKVHAIRVINQIRSPGSAVCLFNHARYDLNRIWAEWWGSPSDNKSPLPPQSSENTSELGEISASAPIAVRKNPELISNYKPFWSCEYKLVFLPDFLFSLQSRVDPTKIFCATKHDLLILNISTGKFSPIIQDNNEASGNNAKTKKFEIRGLIPIQFSKSKMKKIENENENANDCHFVFVLRPSGRWDVINERTLERLQMDGAPVWNKTPELSHKHLFTDGYLLHDLSTETTISLVEQQQQNSQAASSELSELIGVAAEKSGVGSNQNQQLAPFRSACSRAVTVLNGFVFVACSQGSVDYIQKFEERTGIFKNGFPIDERIRLHKPKGQSFQNGLIAFPYSLETQQGGNSKQQRGSSRQIGLFVFDARCEQFFMQDLFTFMNSVVEIKMVDKRTDASSSPPSEELFFVVKGETLTADNRKKGKRDATEGESSAGGGSAQQCNILVVFNRSQRSFSTVTQLPDSDPLSTSPNIDSLVDYGLDSQGIASKFDPDNRRVLLQYFDASRGLDKCVLVQSEGRWFVCGCVEGASCIYVQEFQLPSKSPTPESGRKTFETPLPRLFSGHNSKIVSLLSMCPGGHDLLNPELELENSKPKIKSKWKCWHKTSGKDKEGKGNDGFCGGCMLASVGQDQTVRIWDVKTGACLAVFFEPGRYSSRSLKVHNHGNILLGVHSHTKIFAWDISFLKHSDKNKSSFDRDQISVEMTPIPPKHVLQCGSTITQISNVESHENFLFITYLNSPFIDVWDITSSRAIFLHSFRLNEFRLPSLSISPETGQVLAGGQSMHTVDARAMKKFGVRHMCEYSRPPTSTPSSDDDSSKPTDQSAISGDSIATNSDSQSKLRNKWVNFADHSLRLYDRYSAYVDLFIFVCFLLIDFGQLASFAFRPAVPWQPPPYEPPGTNSFKSFREGLGSLRDIGLPPSLFLIWFWLAVFAICVFLGVFLFQEQLEWKKTLAGPENVGWRSAWVLLSLFAKIVSKGMFFPILGTLFRCLTCIETTRADDPLTTILVLEADTQIQCWTPFHVGHAVVAILFLLIYTPTVLRFLRVDCNLSNVETSWNIFDWRKDSWRPTILHPFSPNKSTISKFVFVSVSVKILVSAITIFGAHLLYFVSGGLVFAGTILLGLGIFLPPFHMQSSVGNATRCALDWGVLWTYISGLAASNEQDSASLMPPFVFLFIGLGFLLKFLWHSKPQSLMRRKQDEDEEEEENEDVAQNENGKNPPPEENEKQEQNVED